MHVKNFQKLLLIFFVSVIVIVLGTTGLLNLSAFNNNITDSLISSYEVSGRECVRKIEYALRYGKTLPTFYGIEEHLSRVREDLPEIDEVRVVSTEGEILFDDEGLVGGLFIPRELKEISFLDEDFMAAGSSHTSLNRQYHLFLPIKDRNNNLEGSLYLSFSQDVIVSITPFYTWQLAGYISLLALAGTVILFIIIRSVPFTLPTGEINKRAFLTVTLLLMGLIQVIFGWLNFNLFRSGYMETAWHNSALISNIVQKDIESDVERGVSYDRLYNLEEYLDRITGAIPEIGTIQLSVRNGELIYTTNGTESTNTKYPPRGPSMVYKQLLIPDDTSGRAVLQVHLSESFFTAKERNIFLDSVTMLALSLILMVEIVIFMIIMLRYQFEKRVASTLEPAGANFDITIVRPLTLILAISVFLACSFIPLRMKELLEPLWGLSDSIIMGLPISAEILFAGLAAFLTGSLIDRRGWSAAFVLGVILFAAGLFFSYQAWNVLSFIVARAVTGAGYGFTLMSLRTFISNRPSEKEKSEGFSSFISGLYAGFIIGVAIGAMLADRIGFARVFLVSLAFCLLATFLIIYYLKLREIKADHPRSPYYLGTWFSSLFVHKEAAAGRAFVQEQQDVYTIPKKGGKGITSFLGNVPVLGFFLFALLPLTMCSMFLDYYFPVFAASQNISTSDVGRAFMLNGIAIVYLGPLLTSYTGKRLSMAMSILVSGLIIVVAFLLFYSFGSVAAAFVAVILLGVSESFGLVAQNSYFVGLKAVSSVGKGLALGYYDNIRNLGKMIGPMLFGGLMAMGNTGIGLIGLITLCLLFMFFLSTRTERRKNY